MNEQQLKQALALAVEKGLTAKAEILESHLEEITDERDSEVGRGLVRSRRLRSLRHEKKSARQAQKRARFPVRQTDPQQPGVSAA